MRKLASVLGLLLFTVTASAQFRGHAPQVSRSDSGLTAPSNAPAEAIVRGFLNRPDRALAVSRQNAGGNGAKHLLMEQTLNGRTVYGAYVKASVDAQGRLTSIIDHSVANGPVAKTSLGASDALSAALAHRFGGAAAPAFHRDPTVTPVVVPMRDG
ncbi:MAG TPA: hypothetical protein VF883_04250, partial [Thermoanaerobaculia bacterium]